ncbi:uncharacterized protein TRAVEDRAFT_34861 [Trametes versicolor FP-101664 SS1]|uniref:uncharacterized protein n=1 Tax=Trametes versicolor (strain FP-101664) TaxID=717944 RepID=UPI0004623545|nr:uncharacterized protein TRAVEDRAFT_34861 [Trametes versicolor FP-101664 SS1]EIW61348.1 hypothetical protein TRAVEDRAFT_34861 [Trametes versicolor FP-101664 SS1]
MSFTFKWPRFSDQFHADAIQMLESALNKGNKPPVIADRIEVVELEMGTQPPELEIRDIGELTVDQFRGIFRLTYTGDAHIVLRTKVQANPLNHKQPDIHLMGGSRGMLAAKQPLVVPMLLRLSHFKLNAYVVLVVSRQKGITLVFKTDPLQNVDINSTFDSIAVIQKFIQREIEGQLRQMFREDLPGIIHRLSQQWVKAKVEAPYLQKPAAPVAVPSRTRSVASSPGEPAYRIPRMPPVGVAPSLIRRASSAAPFMRPRSSSIQSASSMGMRAAMSVASSPSSRIPPQATSQHEHHHHHHDGPTSFPDIENYDPTYGLRPEGLPAKSTFGGFRNLFAQNKGLADLAEESSEIDDMLDETGSFDPSTWEDFMSETNLGPSISEAGDIGEYETVPAVGGGTITRPRVYHTQSQIHVASPDGEAHPTPSASRRPLPSRAGSMQSTRPPSRASSLYNPYFAGLTPYYESVPTPRYSYPSYAESSSSPLRRSPLSIPPVPSLAHSPIHRPTSTSSIHTQPSRSSDMTHSVPTPPPPEEDPNVRITRPRRLSTASSNLDDAFSSSSYDQHMQDHDPKIVLRPSINNSISQLSTLSHSNHTLSPYTRTLEHFTVRSVPPRETNSSGPASSADRQPVRARRKRIHRLGKKPAKPPERSPPFEESAPSSPARQLSEFDASEMDTYFRARDDLIPRYPSLHPSHVRRRVPHVS